MGKGSMLFHVREPQHKTNGRERVRKNKSCETRGIVEEDKARATGKRFGSA